MGIRPDGSFDRRKRSGAFRAEVVRTVRALERERTEQSALPAGRSPRLETWLTEWLAATELRVRPSTLSGYAVDVHRHINPTIGTHRLDALQPKHIEHLYAVLLANGLSAGTRPPRAPDAQQGPTTPSDDGASRATLWRWRTRPGTTRPRSNP